jgi:hypothetical protein
MLLQRVELHLQLTRTPPARFGRDAIGDPCFVFDLRDGREPRSKTVARVLSYIEDRERRLSQLIEPHRDGAKSMTARPSAGAA